MKNSIPLWLKILRIYCHYSPLQRGKIYLIDWTYRHLSIPDVTVKTLLDKEIPITLNLSIWVDYNIYCWGIYEYYLANFFKKQLQSDTVFLDVGAYIGQYAQLAGWVASQGCVYAFEPNEESHKRLTTNILENGLSNIEVIAKGVGANSGTATFYVGSQPSQSSLLASHISAVKTQEIAIISLDEFAEERQLGRVDLIKIDVEEAEDDVIRGALSLIRATRPLIILEIGGKSLQSTQPESLRLLESLNYHFFLLKREQLKPLPSHIFAGEEVIAIPEEKIAHVCT